MVKHFCDMCEKEITGKSINVVDAGNIARIEYIEICNTCKKKYANKILKFLIDEIFVDLVDLEENKDYIPDDVYRKIFEIGQAVMTKFCEKEGIVME